jgi:hypothetical protein
LNPENVAIIKDQLKSDTSVLSEAVGKPAREKALAAMLSMRLQKRRLRKRSAGSSTPTEADTAGDIEMVGGTSSGSAADDDIETGSAETGTATEESETVTEAGSVADEINDTDIPVGETEDFEASECELVPECSICMESFTNPVVCLLKL